VRYNHFMIAHERDKNGDRFSGGAPFQTTREGIALMTRALATVADHVGSRGAGQSFRQTFVPRKKTKAHDYLLWGSPYGRSARVRMVVLGRGGGGAG
jgi:hypothetical protein